MGNIRARSDNNKLFFDFRYQGIRCREQTALDNTAANVKTLKKIMKMLKGSEPFYKAYHACLAQLCT